MASQGNASSAWKKFRGPVDPATEKAQRGPGKHREKAEVGRRKVLWHHSKGQHVAITIMPKGSPGDPWIQPQSQFKTSPEKHRKRTEVFGLEVFRHHSKGQLVEITENSKGSSGDPWIQLQSQFKTNPKKLRKRTEVFESWLLKTEKNASNLIKLELSRFDMKSRLA